MPEGASPGRPGLRFRSASHRHRLGRHRQRHAPRPAAPYRAATAASTGPAIERAAARIQAHLLVVGQSAAMPTARAGTLSAAADRFAAALAARARCRYSAPTNMPPRSRPAAELKQPARQRPAPPPRATRRHRQRRSRYHSGTLAESGVQTGGMAMTAAAMIEQRRADGSLRHLITLEGLAARRDRSAARARAALRARRRASGRRTSDAARGRAPSRNLFTEPSTRTRVSFELAGRRLGAEVVNLEVQLSSRVKGETMLDTIYTLQALHFDVFVIRDAEPGVLAHVAAHVAPACQRAVGRRGAPVAPDPGPARCADDPPAQGHRLRAARIAIVGDIRHSRVARSAYQVFRVLRRTRAAHRRAAGADARCAVNLPAARASTRSRRACTASMW